MFTNASMLSVTIRPIMLNSIILIISIGPFILSVLMLNVVMLSAVMLSVVMLNVIMLITNILAS